VYLPNNVKLDLLDPELLADPYPTFHRLRAEDPVHWEPEPGYWVVTRYDDAVAVLRDPATFSSAIHQGRPAAARSARWFVFRDAPDHTRLRAAAQGALTPQMVIGLRHRIAALVSELLDPIEEAGGCDLIAALAFPLPAIVIAELLGVPSDERARFRQWSADIAAIGGLVGAAPDAAARRARAQASEDALAAYVSDVVRDRQRAAGPHLIGRLLAGCGDAGTLPLEDVVDLCVFLLFAGHETTTNLIGNGMLALLRHPETLPTLRAAPNLWGPAIDELLRFDSPVQARVRVARGDAVLGGRTVRDGDRVLVLLGAANRDPAHFPEPDRLWLARPANRHLAFGAGIHFCLGAALARLEASVALEALVRRFPALELASERVRWRPTMSLRGLEALPLAVR
jgi:cytochrome P450